ncbi:Uncharacterised protein [Mycobacteroides abscessus subsp. abscessus]|nr:Uncharacterised protein [Mycobacteroides abscessus subsp. abscessus]
MIPMPAVTSAVVPPKTRSAVIVPCGPDASTRSPGGRLATARDPFPWVRTAMETTSSVTSVIVYVRQNGAPSSRWTRRFVPGSSKSRIHPSSSRREISTVSLQICRELTTVRKRGVRAVGTRSRGASPSTTISSPAVIVPDSRIRP